MRQIPLKTSAGLTMLELMIALAVLAIIISASVPSFAEFRQTQRLINAAEQVYGHLNQARSEAVARNTEAYVNFSADGSAVWTYGVSTVNSGCDLSATDPALANACVIGDADPVLMRYASAGFEDVSMSIADFPVGSSQIEFDPVRGMATTARIDLTSANDDQLRLRVSRLGRVTLCSPDGSVSQYSGAGC